MRSNVRNVLAQKSGTRQRALCDCYTNGPKPSRIPNPSRPSHSTNLRVLLHPLPNHGVVQHIHRIKVHPRGMQNPDGLRREPALRPGRRALHIQHNLVLLHLLRNHHHGPVQVRGRGGLLRLKVIVRVVLPGGRGGGKGTAGGGRRVKGGGREEQGGGSAAGAGGREAS